MSLDLLLGAAVATLAYLVLVGLVLYNRHIVETIARHNVTNIREVKRLFAPGKRDGPPR